MPLSDLRELSLSSVFISRNKNLREENWSNILYLVFMKERSQLSSRNITFNITEDAVKLVARKILGGSSPGGTELEALQG